MDESRIFAQARQLADPAARAAYLDAACAGNPRLRADVEALLRAGAGDPGFLERPAGPLSGTSDLSSADGPSAEPPRPVAAEQPGAVLGGRYKLIEPIGEGGMGTVWVAQQTEPVRRAVAVKLIKAGMDSGAVLARFEAERQALALMDHPNIAKVLDAGAAPDGRPYFVMELVKGVPITKFCDARKLTPRERLELFVPVCQAVQHAHQKGVIHRDLKPGNVLVALYDDRPVPKVIDFGVAKAAGQPLTDKTLMTGFGAVVGTPEYMSPEQASLNQLDVDTRSDVYALGVLLYELLTGTTPVDRKSLGKAAVLEVLRVVREVEPPRPSQKLSTADALPTIAANRHTEPKRLAALVRGELDWIVMKALEKDRTRRYETANGLAADIGRYLAGEPVQAVPPSAGYKLRKFARKHRGPVVAAGLVFAALVAGAGAATWQAVRADAARRDAEAARQAETEQRVTAEAAQKAEAEQRRVAEERARESDALVTFFQEKVFAAARPKGRDGGLGHDVTLRRAILAAQPAMATDFRDQPLVEARLRHALGTTLGHLGEYEAGRKEFERARAIYHGQRGRDHPDTLASASHLANCYAALGRRADALELCEEVLAARERVLPPEHPDTLVSMSNLAELYAELGRRADALRLGERVLAARKRVLPPDHPDTVRSMEQMAGRYAELGRRAAALKLHEEVVGAYKRVLPPTTRTRWRVCSTWPPIMRIRATTPTPSGWGRTYSRPTGGNCRPTTPTRSPACAASSTRSSGSAAVRRPSR